jgi:hypothetical protein
VKKLTQIFSSEVFHEHLRKLLYSRPVITLINIAIAIHLRGQIKLRNYHEMDADLNNEITMNLDSFMISIGGICTYILNMHMHPKLVDKVLSHKIALVHNSLLINYCLLTQRSEIFAMYVRNHIFETCQNQTCLNPLCNNKICIPDY